MNLWHAFVFGLVEGVTEFLPVSSTGHLMLTAKLLGYAQTEFIKSFEIAIQLGAILAVAAIYWKRLLTDMKIWINVLAAFIPTAVIGLLLHKIVKQYLLASYSTVLSALFLGGLFLIVFEAVHKDREDASDDVAGIPLATCVLIGIIQSLAMVPGVSRSAATIVGGLMLGLRRKTVVEFSFLLAIPTMAAATGLDILKSGSAFSIGQFHFLALGFLASFFFAVLSIKFLMMFIQKHNFISFGVYRVLVSTAFFIFR